MTQACSSPRRHARTSRSSLQSADAPAITRSRTCGAALTGPPETDDTDTERRRTLGASRDQPVEATGVKAANASSCEGLRRRVIQRQNADQGESRRYMHDFANHRHERMSW